VNPFKHKACTFYYIEIIESDQETLMLMAGYCMLVHVPLNYLHARHLNDLQILGTVFKIMELVICTKHILLPIALHMDGGTVHVYLVGFLMQLDAVTCKHA
jgi:hypothetical protein